MINKRSEFTLILRGGNIVFLPKPDDPQQQKLQPIHLERYGLSFLILGLAIWLCIPLMILPSSIGFISYSYPNEFLHLTGIQKYLTLLLYNLLIALKSLLSIEPFPIPSLPEPISGFWKAIVSFVIIIGDAAAVYFVVKSFRIFQLNYQRLTKARDRIMSDFNKEIHYASFLPNLPRKGRTK